MTRKFWFGLAFILVCLSANGQVEIDSIPPAPKAKKKKWVPVPKKAALLSLMPGVGQLYNRKYAAVKVPIIYAGFAGIGYWAYDNQKKYEGYRDAYVASINGEEHQYGAAPAADLKRARDNFDKFRQRTYISLAAIYLAQVIEAYVSAHLIDFDIEDDLSIKIEPTFQEEYAQKVGFGAILSF